MINNDNLESFLRLSEAEVKEGVDKIMTNLPEQFSLACLSNKLR